MRIAVIANPVSGEGRGARTLHRIRPTLARFGITDVRVTSAHGDTVALVNRAIDDGVDAIIALGGDGTWSQCAGAVAARGADTTLALLAAGTGNDFVETLRLPARDVVATVTLLRDGAVRRIDMGRVDDHFFLNSVGFGFDAHVARVMTRRGVLAPRARYAWLASRDLWRYRARRVAIDGGAAQHALTVVVSNAQRFGGVFWIAPHASLEDGNLDLVLARDVGPLRRVELFARVIAGRHLHHPDFEFRTAPAFRLAFDEAPWYQADGEVRQARSADLVVENVSRVLNLVAPV